MSGLEGIGEAVAGGLAACAVEPEAGGARGHADDSACLNCGTKLHGSYCHECGQKGHVHKTLGAFWHDLAHSVLHLEGKTWRTLPKLAVRPGDLTRRYVNGERAKFVSPMALFLFSVFLMFAVFSTIGGPFDFSSDGEEFRNTQMEISSILQTEQRSLRQLQERRARAASEGEASEVQELDAALRTTEQRIATLSRVNALPNATNTQLIGGIETGWKRLDDGIKKLNQNPALAFYKIQNNAYKFSWLLIPLSVPFLWLLFPFRRGTNLYFHTVFVTYSISFMTLLSVAVAILLAIGVPGSLTGIILSVAPPLHMFLQLKGAYQLRWWSALLRMLLLLFFTGIVLTLFLIILIVLGAIG